MQTDKQTDVVLYGSNRSSCSGDEELKLGRWGVEVVMKEGVGKRRKKVLLIWERKTRLRYEEEESRKGDLVIDLDV